MLPCLTLLGFLGCPLPSEENARPNVPILQGQGKGQAGNPGNATTNTNAGGNAGNPGQGKPPTNAARSAVRRWTRRRARVVRIEDGQGGGGQPDGAAGHGKQGAQQNKKRSISPFTPGEVKGDTMVMRDVIGTDNLGEPKEGGEPKVQSPPLA